MVATNVRLLSVFQFRHHQGVRIRFPENQLKPLKTKFAPTYPLERKTRFARDRRQFRSKIIRDVRFARDRRQLFTSLENGRNARDPSTFQGPRQMLWLINDGKHC